MLYKKIIKEYFYYVLSKVVPGLIGLISVILFVRMIGITQFGQYGLYIAQCNLIAAIGFGWLNQSTLRYYSVDKLESHFVEAQVKAFLIAGISSLLLLTLFSFFQKMEWLVWCVSIWVILSTGGFNFIKTKYQAKIQPLNIMWFASAQALLAFTIPLFLLVGFQKNGVILLLGVGISYSLVLVAPALKYSSLLFRSRRSLRLSAKNYWIKKWLLFGGPLSIWFAMGLAFPFLDRMFISYYGTPNTLGGYVSIQELLTRVFSLTLFPFILAIHPRVTKSWNENKFNDTIHLVRNSIILMLVIGLFLLSITLIFNEIIFSMLQLMVDGLDPKFHSLIFPLLMTGFLWQLSFLTHKMIELEEKTNRMIIFLIPSLLINIIANAIFLPKYGVVATAFGALASALIYCILTGVYSLVLMKKSVLAP